ncbi:MAG: hypothetical protein HZB44_05230, partial [Actinobacteria bacterium]|nr:hypothetical protein [Actinomycetota bacterium]
PLSGCTVGATGVSCAASGLADGAHTIGVSVADMAGNTGTGSGSFTVDTVVPDTTTPAVTNVMPSGIITTTSATVSAYYSDAESGINSATAAITLDGSAMAGCTATASTISCPATGLAQGAHNISVSVTDNAANTGTGTGSFTVDSLAPTVSGVTPTGTITSAATTVYANYTDATSGINTASVSVSVDTTTLTGCTVAAGSVSCPASGLAEGAHNITVSVTDNAGNTGTGTGSFTVDTAAPSVTNVLPSGTITTTSATLSAYFSDATSGLNTATAVLRLDGSAVTGCTTTASGISCPTTGLAQGAHSLSVSVADNAGNVGSNTGSFTVDSLAPSVTNILPTGTISTTTATVSANYTDATSGINTATAVVTLDGTTMTGCTVTATGVSCAATGLTNGTHNISISVADNAGNTGTGTGSFTVSTGPTCETSYTDATGATMEVFSDSGYTTRVCQSTQLTANTDYYVQLTHPTMDMATEGSNRNRMRLYNMLGTQVNFGDGTTEKTFTQQSGGAPYRYRATFRTPTTADVYMLEPSIRNTAQDKQVTVYGWITKVGSTTSYVRTYSDSGYTVETNTFAPGATVYMEMYGAGLTDGTPTTAATTVNSYNFTATATSITETSVTRTAARTYRVQFNMPSTTTDQGIRVSVSSGTVLARPELLLNVASGSDTTAPSVTNVLPTGTITTSSTTVSASYSDAGSGINSATAKVYLDGTAMTGCTATASSISCPATGLANGTHNISVSVADVAGNTGTGTGSFTVSVAASCTTTFTDTTGATITVYSDAAYTTPVCQSTQLNTNTDYYMQVTHPTMDLATEGSNRNRMRLYNMMGTQVNFGDGTADEVFVQQSGGAPYRYRSTFRTPTTADLYTLEPSIRNSAQTKQITIYGWMMKVGSTANYVRTYSDSGYSVETDTFAPGATVYVQMYSAGFGDGTPTTSATTINSYDFIATATAITETSVTRTAARTYRTQFTMPATTGDKGIRISISSGTVLARPELLLNVQ